VAARAAIAVRIGGWFFAHAGNTAGRTQAQLEHDLEAAVDRDDFRADELVGEASILEARDWYAEPAVVTSTLAALGVAHVVFGHDPNALGPVGRIAVGQDGALIRIDCGMSPDVDDSAGALLRIRGDSAEQLAADGTITHLWP